MDRLGSAVTYDPDIKCRSHLAGAKLCRPVSIATPFIRLRSETSQAQRQYCIKAVLNFDRLRDERTEKDSAGFTESKENK